MENRKEKKIEERLKAAGAVKESSPQYALFRYKLGDGIVTFYQSGSVVYGGKNFSEVKKIVDSVLFDFEDKTPRVGCDEAGKGEAIGPLVVAAVFADEKAIKEFLRLGIKDSKKLSDDKVLELSESIKNCSKGVVKVLMPEKYNQIYSKYKNLNRLLDVVYLEIIGKLVKKVFPKKIVVDKYGNRIEGILKEKFKNLEISVVEKAESDIVVAAASIVARAERIKKMKELESKYGIKLPLGNNKQEIESFLKTVPSENLKYLVKLHFKNVEAK